mgnify:CR=1 FL=1
MQITAAQLNEVATLLGTTDRQVVISAVMKTLVQSGISADVAMDAVFGEGSYKRFAGQVYDALRA